MNNGGRTLIIAIVLLGTLLWTSSPALADGVTYTETDVASGSLGGASFSDALVTITLLGDTSTSTTGIFGALEVFGPTTVTVDGIGTASLLIAWRLLIAQFSVRLAFWTPALDRLDRTCWIPWTRRLALTISRQMSVR